MLTRARLRDYSEEEVQTAVELIKNERPELWARFTEHEKNDEGYRDIAEDLLSLLSKLTFVQTLADKAMLLSRIRKEVRRQSNLPI